MSWFGGGGPTGWELELCESPATKTDYEDLAQRSLKSLLELGNEAEITNLAAGPLKPLSINSPSTYDPTIAKFRIIDAELEAKLFDKQDPKQIDQIVKTEAVLPVSPQELFETIWTDPLEKRRRWETGLVHFEHVESVTEDIDVNYLNIAAPFPVTTRDAVNIRCKKVKNEGGVIYCWGTAINHKSKPFNSKFVRAAGSTCWIIRPIEGEKYKTHVTKVIRINPMGNIPGWVVNLTKTKLGEGWLALRKHLNINAVPMRAEREAKELEEAKKAAAAEVKGISEEVPLVRRKRPAAAAATAPESESDSDTESDIYYDAPTFQTDPIVMQTLKGIELMMQQISNNTNKLNDRVSSLESSMQITTRKTSLNWVSLFKWLALTLSWPIVLYLIFQIVRRFRSPKK